MPSRTHPVDLSKRNLDETGRPAVDGPRHTCKDSNMNFSVGVIEETFARARKFGFSRARGQNRAGRNMPSAQNLVTGSNWQNRARRDQKRQVCGAGSNVCGAGINVHPDRHKHLTPPRKLAFFGRAARDFASLILSPSFARTACSAPRDFGPARAKIQTSARAQKFLQSPPQKNSLDEQRYDGDRQRQAVPSRLGFAWINQRDGYGMALLSIPLTPVVDVVVFFRAD
ncbi:hypothetical protein B0H11DRAFT_1914879 [Mycena galericulata]|nr:hypothetical protein B0H11DRAFT_1914879 [Mycena galericulata]